MPSTSSQARRRPANRPVSAQRVFDPYRSFPTEYQARAEPGLVTVSPASYLAVDGTGEPGGAEFTAGVGALFAVAYGIAMARRKEGKPTFRVPKLEALWHAASEHDFLTVPREAWSWTLLLRVPDFVEDGELATASAAATKRGVTHAALVHRLSIDEGACAQVLHVGPYAGESETLAGVSAMLDRLGLARHGSHHELYLTDPRRTPPERTRTILRHPVRRAAALASR